MQSVSLTNNNFAQPDSEYCCHCQLRQIKTNISKVFTILHKFLGTPWGPIGQDSLPKYCYCYIFPIKQTSKMKYQYTEAEKDNLPVNSITGYDICIVHLMSHFM